MNIEKKTCVEQKCTAFNAVHCKLNPGTTLMKTHLDAVHVKIEIFKLFFNIPASKNSTFTIMLIALYIRALAFLVYYNKLVYKLTKWVIS
jgi:hypothetical protein